jgi:hypothetical protein
MALTQAPLRVEGSWVEMWVLPLRALAELSKRIVAKPFPPVPGFVSVLSVDAHPGWQAGRPD